MTSKGNLFKFSAVFVALILFAAVFSAEVSYYRAFALSDGGEYITSLTVSDTSVNSYDKIRVDVSFSDGSPDESVFKGGDIIEIKWTADGEARLKGYKKTMSLVSSDGITYGKVDVKSDAAVITFNDNVNDMFDVNGSFFFEVMAVNETDTTQEDTKTVEITDGSKIIEIHITKPASGGSGAGGDTPDYRKQAGEIGGGWSWVDQLNGWAMGLDPDDPSYTEWYLTANEKKEKVSSDITIRDNIGGGQSVDTSWVHVYSAGKLKIDYEGTVQAVCKKLEETCPGFVLSFGGDNVNVTIPQQYADEEAWYIIYRCDITDFSLLSFDNGADFSWTKDDGTPVSGHSESHFAGLQSGQNINVLPRGVLQVTKKVGNTDVTLEGVVFKLEKEIDGEWVDVATLKSDSNGFAMKSKLKSGHYRLYETSVPEWVEPEYTLSSPYEFDLDLDNPNSQGIAITVRNPIKTVDVKGEKIWQLPDGSIDGSAHQDIWFQLYRKNSKTDKVAKVGEPEVLHDGELSITWDDLPGFDVHGNDYVYFIKETDESGSDMVPDGYSKVEERMKVTNIKEEEPTSESETSTDITTTEPVTEPETTDITTEPVIETTTETTASEPASESGEATETTAAEPEIPAAVTTTTTPSYELETSITKATESSLESEDSKDSEPETGDDTNLFLWFSIMILSGAVLATVLIRRKG